MKYFDMKSLILAILALTLVFSCSNDDDSGNNPVTDDPVSSFQFAIDENDFLTVNFSNFSLNSTSNAWDFGDGMTSTEENPSHTYAEAGDYVVSLTVSNGTESRSSEKTVTLVNPASASDVLTGGSSKIWKLNRNLDAEEWPLSVGPQNRSEIWWAYGRNEPIGTRTCIMEEEYIFNTDGSFVYDTKGFVYADENIWNADAVGECVDENDASLMSGPNGEDLTAWGSGTFTFDYDPSAATLSINGLGAHIGLPKVGTDGEYTTPQAGVTYKVISVETDGAVDKMVLETDLLSADGYWQFILVSYDNPADEPDLPGAPPTASFTHELDGRTATFTNNSNNADSYSWDFGDGMTSNEENPVYTYAADGNYTVVLTASNANGSVDASTNIIVSTTSVFSAATMFGSGSKSWKLNPDANALAVGPAKGSGEWFATSLDDVTNRNCTFDDTYTFDNMDGFAYSTNGDLWAEAYMGIDPAACITDDMLPDDAKAWGSGNHSFTITEASGDDPAYLTVTGTGAFIGLPKAFNGGEYSAGPPPTDASVTYEVLSYVNDGSNEILQLTIDISDMQVGGAYWTFTLRAD